MLFDRDEAPEVLTPEQEDLVHAQGMRILDGDRPRRAPRGDARPPRRGRAARSTATGCGSTRTWVMAQVAKAPRTFTLHARNPANTVEVGGGTPLWMGVGGPPFFSDLDEGRRGGTLEGHDRMIKLTQAAPPAQLRADRRVRAGEDGRPHPPPRHGVLHDPVVGPAVHHVRDERPEGPRRHRDGPDRPRRRPGRPHRADGRRELGEPADLGLPDGRRAVGVGRGEPGDGRDPVPARRARPRR